MLEIKIGKLENGKIFTPPRTIIRPLKKGDIIQMHLKKGKESGGYYPITIKKL